MIEVHITEAEEMKQARCLIMGEEEEDGWSDVWCLESTRMMRVSEWTSAGRMEIAGVKSVSRYEWTLSTIGSAGGVKASTLLPGIHRKKPLKTSVTFITR